MISAETACWDIKRKEPNLKRGLLLAVLPSSLGLALKIDTFLGPEMATSEHICKAKFMYIKLPMFQFFIWCRDLMILMRANPLCWLLRPNGNLLRLLAFVVLQIGQMIKFGKMQILYLEKSLQTEAAFGRCCTSFCSNIKLLKTTDAPVPLVHFFIFSMLVNIS